MNWPDRMQRQTLAAWVRGAAHDDAAQSTVMIGLLIAVLAVAGLMLADGNGFVDSAGPTTWGAWAGGLLIRGAPLMADAAALVGGAAAQVLVLAGEAPSRRELVDTVAAAIVVLQGFGLEVTARLASALMPAVGAGFDGGIVAAVLAAAAAVALAIVAWLVRRVRAPARTGAPGDDARNDLVRLRRLMRMARKEAAGAPVLPWTTVDLLKACAEASGALVPEDDPNGGTIVLPAPGSALGPSEQLMGAFTVRLGFPRPTHGTIVSLYWDEALGNEHDVWRAIGTLVTAAERPRPSPTDEDRGRAVARRKRSNASRRFGAFSMVPAFRAGPTPVGPTRASLAGRAIVAALAWLGKHCFRLVLKAVSLAAAATRIAGSTATFIARALRVAAPIVASTARAAWVLARRRIGAPLGLWIAATSAKVGPLVAVAVRSLATGGRALSDRATSWIGEVSSRIGDWLKVALVDVKAVGAVGTARLGDAIRRSARSAARSTRAEVASPAEQRVCREVDPNQRRVLVRLRVDADSQWVGMTIGELAEALDASVIACQAAGGCIPGRPAARARLTAGDIVAMVCPESVAEQLRTETEQASVVP